MPLTKLSRKDANALLTALKSLNGFAKAVGEKTIFVPFKFTDETRKKIKKNLRALRDLPDDDQDERLRLIQEITDNSEAAYIEPKKPDGSDNDAQIQKFNYAMLQWERKEIEVDLTPISETELLCENKNPIDGTTLDDLSPITDAPPPKVEPEGGE